MYLMGKAMEFHRLEKLKVMRVQDRSLEADLALCTRQDLCSRPLLQPIKPSIYPSCAA